VAAARRIDLVPCGEIYNVGRGEGATVLEVLRTVAAVTGIDFGYEVLPRRPGDAAQVVANVDRARQELGWSARYDLHDMVRSAWEAWQYTMSVSRPEVQVASGRGSPDEPAGGRMGVGIAGRAT
jgi:UDP-glucose 4-epimerase